MPSVSSHADILRTQQLPDPLLIVQIRTRRIPEAIPLPAIPRSKPLLHRHRPADRESPSPRESADAAIPRNPPPFDRQRLQPVREEILAARLHLFRFLAHTRARRHHEHRQMIALAVLRGQNIIAQAQPVLARLPAEMERVDRRSPHPARTDESRCPSRSASKNCHTAFSFRNVAASPLQRVHQLVQLERLRLRPAARSFSKLPL